MVESPQQIQPQKSDKATIVTVILGPAGAGKTTLLNEIMNQSYETGVETFSVTENWVKCERNVGGQTLALWDGPGLGTSQDQFKSSSIIRHGLCWEPLNAIFVAVPYEPRIIKMVESFSETLQTFK